MTYSGEGWGDLVYPLVPLEEFVLFKALLWFTHCLPNSMLVQFGMVHQDTDHILIRVYDA